MGGRNKYYVVFNGRKVGVFQDWGECQAQVTGFSGMAFEGFQTLEEAHAAWQRFRSRTAVEGVDEVEAQEMQEAEPEIPSAAGPSCSSLIGSLQGLSLEGNGGNIPEYERDSPKQDFLVEYSLEGLLAHVCETLKIPPPTWSLADSKEHAGVLHHQYTVAVVGGGIYRPSITCGKYNVHHEDARDSAALTMLRSLLERAGKGVKDYNYHAISEMAREHNEMADRIHALTDCLVQNETQFADLAAESNKKNDQISIMAEEIALLEHEVRSLKAVLGW